MKRLCKRLKVPKSCCYLEFMPKQPRRITDKPKIKTEYSHSVTELDSRDPTNSTLSTSLETVRGEQVIIDFNKHDQIIGIELLGSKKARKPCQNWTNV